MTALKSYTDISQSKKLAKILPIESADMYYTPPLIKGHTDYIPRLKRKFPIDWDIEQAIPCWSLAALLDALPEKYTELIKEGGMYRIIIKDSFMTCLFDNPVDACVAMIEKLHELKML